MFPEFRSFLLCISGCSGCPVCKAEDAVDSEVGGLDSEAGSAEERSKER